MPNQQALYVAKVRQAEVENIYSTTLKVVLAVIEGLTATACRGTISALSRGSDFTLKPTVCSVPYVAIERRANH
jgi:hypothetical protein